MKSLAALIAMSAAMLCACGTPTSTTHTWKAEQVAPGRPQNVVVFGGRMTEPMRRSVEDGLVQELSARGVRATPSHRIFATLPQRDIAQAEVKRLGFDGAVVASLREIRERETYVPGHYSGGFWSGYYGPGWGTSAYSPGYMVRDELVNMETTVWDLRPEQGNLVWASNTQTRNPSSTSDFVESFVDELVPNLERAGLVRSR